MTGANPNLYTKSPSVVYYGKHKVKRVSSKHAPEAEPEADVAEGDAEEGAEGEGKYAKSGAAKRQRRHHSRKASEKPAHKGKQHRAEEDGDEGEHKGEHKAGGAKHAKKPRYAAEGSEAEDGEEKVDYYVPPKVRAAACSDSSRAGG